MTEITDDKPIGNKRRIVVGVIWAVMAGMGWMALVEALFGITMFVLISAGLRSSWVILPLGVIAVVVMLVGMFFVGRYAYREKMYGRPAVLGKKGQGFLVLVSGDQVDREMNHQD